MVHEIDVCSHILPYLHLFHEDAYFHANRGKAINKLLNVALPLSENDVYIIRCLMDLYLLDGRPEEAIALDRKYTVDSGIKSTKYYCFLGQAYLRCGRPAEAIELFKQAEQRDPSYPMSYRMIAEAYLLQERFAEAEKSCRQALELARLRISISLYEIIDTGLLLGNILVKKGEPEEALVVYNRLLLDYPLPTKRSVAIIQAIDVAYWHQNKRRVLTKPAEAM